jgi:hypothetical protein
VGKKTLLKSLRNQLGVELDESGLNVLNNPAYYFDCQNDRGEKYGLEIVLIRIPRNEDDALPAFPRSGLDLVCYNTTDRGSFQSACDF